jgi:hypothetical protein
VGRCALYQQAYEVIDKAIVANGAERHLLLAEALRLHRLAVEEGLRRRAGETPHAPPKGEDT